MANALSLPNVTLCAVSSVNVEATMLALQASIEQAEFAEVLFFTDFDFDANRSTCPPGIRIVTAPKLASSEAYSDFILNDLVGYIETDFCLIAQWDGHVINAAHWRDAFLQYDYIGASWPQFNDGNQVGNGGFSLRSKRLMQLCLEPEFKAHHPEDISICRTNAAFLEGKGLRFAPVDIADAFSAERAGDPAKSFGYHGVFLMPQTIGPERFWNIYLTLTDRSTVWHDWSAVTKQLLSAPGGTRRALALAVDRFKSWFKPQA